MNEPSSGNQRSEDGIRSARLDLPSGAPSEVIAISDPGAQRGPNDAAPLEAEPIAFDELGVSLPSVPFVAILAGRPQLLLDSVLAQGGMGTVYEGSDAVTGAKIAVKVMFLDGPTGAYEEWARQEAVVMAHVAKEPNIAHFLEAGLGELTVGGVERPVRYLVTLRYDHTLGSVVNDPSYSQRDKLELFVEACTGLESAHKHGVVHCDTKLANFLVYDRTRVALHDFGLSFIRHDPTYQPVAPPGSTFGTFETLAPEQLTGNHDFDHRADIFAMGINLHELLTGKFPHQRERDAYGDEVLSSANTPITLDRNLPSGIRAILKKALAIDPADRYQSMTELKEDLGRFLRGEIVGAADRLNSLEEGIYRAGRVIANYWESALKYAGVLLLGAAGALAGERLLADGKSSPKGEEPNPALPKDENEQKDSKKRVSRLDAPPGETQLAEARLPDRAAS